jgi:predicted O-methyltransferase YrrM
MLLHLRPRRYFEIGSGFSSALVADVRDRHFDDDLEMTLVEPNPERLESLLANGDLDRIRLLRMPAQEVPFVEFERLEAGDVLFIDSTHVLKTGSDVNHELFHVLPLLRRGVVVHFHDIHPGFEYLRESVLAGFAWNEAYALRAFLQFNPAFEILLWPPFLWRMDRQRVERDWPLMATNPGGALWLIRR